MTLTYRALCLLHAFDHRLPVPDGLAFDSLLRATRLDYSVQSLERVDIFLDALRKTRKIDPDRDLDQLSVRNLLLLLAFYVGEVIGRAAGVRPHWSTYEEVAAQEGQADPPLFENSATLSFPGHPELARASFLPLVTITGRLFADPPDKSVLRGAAMLLAPAALQRPASSRPLAPVPAPAWPVALGPARFQPPPPAAGRQLRQLVEHAPVLLRQGRVVWGAIVQADQALLEPGPGAGAAAEVLVDPHGRVPDADLHAVARTVLALKGRNFDLPDLAAIAQYLNDDGFQAAGLELPARLSPYPLQVSTSWFERAHLPGGVLAQPLVPVLVSDALPGLVLPLPAAFWPPHLRQAWAPAGLQPMAQEPVVHSVQPAYLPDSGLAHLEPTSLADEGQLWFSGTDVAQDYSKARLAWSKAAASGNVAGLEGLAQLYEHGLGVEEDLQRALGYYEQAAARNHGPSREAAARVRKQLASRGSLLGRLLKR